MPVIRLIISLILASAMLVVAIVAGSFLLVLAIIVVGLLFCWFKYRVWRFKRQFPQTTMQDHNRMDDIIDGDYEVVDDEVNKRS